ncbi:NUDIX domain-containing protein [Amycolatopsis cihanbeyliensis]|uniref:ADP-ribose pyrophosphatase YjhB (NUDIX family) n=1 Tax=Amycolatopsis cihanbeyliensis TaxID=1128664 RepID=A0A542DK49_AMYCI|nr:NUDIX hydrolase [Amycolatopsis cihanbeyliensis]TQJ03456.1 ADP-ribose pyrophosphatase YjhB (NUDIX family) [Amycolatopsis cihanbeyliensis]
MTISTPRVAAGVIFTDHQDRVLLVRPTYKDYWDIPGGYVTRGESPRHAAVREVREELGLDVRIGRMLAVDWAPAADEGDKLLFLFTARLPSDAVFSFEDGEIAEARYVNIDELEEFTIDRLCRRIRSAVESPAHTYLEHGVMIGSADVND